MNYIEEILLKDEEATMNLGSCMGRQAQAGDIYLLQGDLGAGKTTLTKGIAQGLGFHGSVSSPTFTLVHEYPGRLPIYHFDLYRLDEPEQVLEIGWDDYVNSAGVLVVEWAERLGPFRPARNLQITLLREEEGRLVRLCGEEKWVQRVAREWKKLCSC